jgi:CMP-N-acetylneuraminic acid synthetase
MKFFLIIKQESVRVPNKNFLKLGRDSLWEIMVKKLLTQNVFIDTDSNLILDKCKKKYKNVIAYKRHIDHINLEVNNNFGVSPVLLMIERFLDTYVNDDEEIIITPHVTSPFISLRTILDAVTYMNKDFDSVQASIHHKEFCYFMGKPVNFNPDVVQKTQDLEPVIMGNGAFFIFTKKSFKKFKNRTGFNPYFYPLSSEEGFEIDYPEDYELAKKIYKII